MWQLAAEKNSSQKKSEWNGWQQGILALDLLSACLGERQLRK